MTRKKRNWREEFYQFCLKRNLFDAAIDGIENSIAKEKADGKAYTAMWLLEQFVGKAPQTQIISGTQGMTWADLVAEEVKEEKEEVKEEVGESPRSKEEATMPALPMPVVFQEKERKPEVNE